MHQNGFSNLPQKAFVFELLKSNIREYDFCIKRLKIIDFILKYQNSSKIFVTIFW